MIELELTYLAKYLPKDLDRFSFKEMIDIYIPEAFDHPKIRIRKNGNKYEITKKEPVADDTSEMLEQTIKITEAEFGEFNKLPGKRLHKRRYFYDYGGKMAEIDVFMDDLEGLVLVDFEFETAEDKASFTKPDFCLTDGTKMHFIAGGMLCGKKYADIESSLNSFYYKKIF